MSDGMRATRIGCDQLHYAPVTKDDGEDLVIGTPVALPGVMKLNINPNSSQDTLFYDDGPGDVASTLGNIEVELDKNALSTAQKAALLGHEVDDKGGLVYAANSVPPWVALGFRTLKSNGKYRYVWLFKGKFMEPSDNNETKGDSIQFQPDTITGRFVKVNTPIAVDATTDVYPWKYEMDEEDTEADATTIAAWFTTVPMPTFTP